MKHAIRIFTILLIFLFSVSLLAQGKGKFVGSTQAKKYHTEDCAAAKKIAKENLITFTSAAEAKAKGYEPCKTCKPDMPGDVKKETKKEAKEAKAVKKEAVKEGEAVKKEAVKESKAVKKEAVKEAEAVKKEAVKESKAVKKEAVKEAEAVKKEAAKKAEEVKK